MTTVLLFAKAPRAGLVKTRLARDVGEERALALYRSVGARVAARVGAAYPITVWFEPQEAENEMRAWLGNREFRRQPTGDLGLRMQRAFATHLDRGDRPVIAIGADAPGVDATVVAEAVRALETADVVLGPAVDGGYYLLGVARSIPDLFREIPWGTATVLARTLDRCQALGVSTALLATLRDLDTAADLAPLGLDSP